MSVNESIESKSIPFLIDRIKYDERGLVPAIVQDYLDGTVLMMAWMNSESLQPKRSPQVKPGFGVVLANNFGIKAQPADTFST